MKKGDQVKALQGDFAGYYGEVLRVNASTVLVSHKPDFEGLTIAKVDFEEPPAPVEVETND